MNSRATVADCFDTLYRSVDRYWWRQPDRYALSADAYPHSLVTQITMRLIGGNSPGRALDLGAGEGADSIRLALLGYTVRAVEISQVGVEKIRAFAEQAGVEVAAEHADITEYQPEGEYDIILCNGVLHYVADKKPVLKRMQAATRPGGLNVISLWSTFTPVPACHDIIPTYCDDEDGVVTSRYAGWHKELLYFEHSKPEVSHSGMPPHSHSHIKLIARRPQ